MLHLYLFSTAIFMLNVLLNLLTACFHPSCGFAAQGFLLLIPFPSIFLKQELTSIFTLSSLTLVNCGILFLCLFFHLPLTWTLSKEECQDTSHVKLDLHLLPLFFLLSSIQGLAMSGFFFLFFNLFLFALNRYPFNIKRKKLPAICHMNIYSFAFRIIILLLIVLLHLSNIIRNMIYKNNC